MANHEKDTSSVAEKFDQRSLDRAGEAQREALQERLERGQEQNKESVESARAEALEQASRAERERQVAEKQVVTPERKHALISKQDKEQSFNTTMREVRSQLSPINRTFSKVIHQPVVEKTSEFLGNTVARPNAILSGSLFAFLITAAFYLIARFNGYPLSGTETIATFIIGWCVGLIFDYIRLLFAGKK